jgi:hypothetical protein
MDLVYIIGLMEEYMKASFCKIKRMGLAFTHGLMAVALKATGLMVNNMDWALTLFHRMANLSLDYGRKAKELSGLQTSKLLQ